MSEPFSTISNNSCKPAWYDELSGRLNNGGHENVILVTGKDSYRVSGAERLINIVLDGCQFVRVCDFSCNPKKEDLVAIINELEEINYTAIIAVGGGSVLDVAKLIKCFSGKADQIDHVLYHGVEPNPNEAELFAIPTTAGSGSEATQFAVLYDKGKKFSVSHEKLMPTASWVVPSLLVPVPQPVAASAAMDAFCQGIESYWSIHSTQSSKAFAREAIILSWNNMEQAVVEGDESAMALMGKASHLAGKAINETRTTAPHAISYALTTYFGIQHGHAVALMLPGILRFNREVSDEDLLDQRGVDYVISTLEEICQMIECRDVKEAAELISAKLVSLGLSMNLKELGVSDPENIKVIIENGFNPERVNNNPRRLDEEDLEQILFSMLERQ